MLKLGLVLAKPHCQKVEPLALTLGLLCWQLAHRPTEP